MPRKGINVYKRKDGRWEGRYIKARTPENKAIYGYVYAKSFQEAKSLVLEKHEAVKELVFKNLSDISFREAVSLWKQATFHEHKASTKIKYQNMLDHYILPNIGNCRISQIDHDCLLELSKKLLSTGGCHGTGLKNKTVSDIIALTKNVLNFLCAKGYQVAPSYRLISVKCVHNGFVFGEGVIIGLSLRTSGKREAA